MKTRTADIKRILTGIILVVLLASPLGDAAAGDGSGRLTLDLRDNELRIDAGGVPLGEVIDAIGQHLTIDFEGFQADRQRPVAFSTTARSPEILVKKLLRYLGARNYVCEYIENRLVKVIVFPQGGSPAKQSSAPDSVKRLSVIEVVEVIEETQAEALGIEPGDIVLKYDGIRINTYDDLIEESTKGHGSRMIQMILLRKKRLVSVFLEGGYIGVRIRAKRIPASAIPADLDGW